MLYYGQEERPSGIHLNDSVWSIPLQRGGNAQTEPFDILTSTNTALGFVARSRVVCEQRVAPTSKWKQHTLPTPTDRMVCSKHLRGEKRRVDDMDQ